MLPDAGAAGEAAVRRRPFGGCKFVARAVPVCLLLLLLLLF